MCRLLPEIARENSNFMKPLKKETGKAKFLFKN
jgi:hypothetical protein